ncbi:MAG: metallopeptidase TldD-related protein [Nannocystaceae bacterium]|nr:metallopeptidase TldD-related protein [bacterium]
MSLRQNQTKAIITQALEQASLGDVRVSVSASKGGNARWGDSMPTTSGDIERLTVSVTAVTRDGRKATAQSNDTSKSGLAKLVAQAESMAALSPVDPEIMPPRGETRYLAAKAFDRKVSTMKAATRAPIVQSAIEAGTSQGLAMSGYLAHSDRTVAAGDRAGLFGYTRSTQLRASTTARTADGTGSAKAARVGFGASTVDGDALASEAALWALRSKEPTPLDPGDYTVILAPQAVSDLLGFLVGAMSHRAAVEGRSFFSAPGGKTKIGQALFHPSITLRSDPTDAKNPAAVMTTDGDPQPMVTWIEKGVLRALRAGRFWGDQAGVPVRPSPSSLHLSGGASTDSLLDLIGKVDKGVLVSRLWYNRMLQPRTITSTGLTRDGTFWIEGGKIVRPVKNLRYNDSVVTLLSNVAEMGAPVRAGGTTDRTDVVPPMIVDGFHFDSTSDAV